MIRRALLVVAFIALAGCAERTPQERRERLVADCISRYLNPLECAEAGQQTIPENSK